MKIAAVYCRVSSDHQERDGTSLQTQLEKCLDYCQVKGYDIAHRFVETYSGMDLDRPKLNEVRELARNGEIDTIIVYCLDRLSRDPVHGVIITEELEKCGVALEAVTEPIDSSDFGKLITYIRGFASKIEAQKIRERSMRGKRAKAKMGFWPGGGASELYGYHYIKSDGKSGGYRVIDEDETKWVRQMFSWLVDEGLSAYQITYRLRAENVPTPSGKTFWIKSTVTNILHNEAYIGKTYAFTCSYTEPSYRRKLDTKRKLSHPVMKPKDQWLELPGFTPAIISKETYEAAQKQLKVNSNNSRRNTKHEYLLRGHLRCRRCGYGYSGSTICVYLADHSHYLKRAYRCVGSWKVLKPVNTCHNHNWGADHLESLVWEKIEHILANPETIIKEIENRRNDVQQLGALEVEVERTELQLKSLGHEQEKLLQWALKGFPEETVISENKRINERRATLDKQKAELETQVKAGRESAVTLPHIERFVKLIQDKLSKLDFESKRMALDMLGIKVYLDGYNVEITGTVPIGNVNETSGFGPKPLM
jgi:site-specific DNA recombinase